MVLRGNAVSEVTEQVTKSGRKVVKFRLATNDSWWDRERSAYVEAAPNYLWVVCWTEALGDNVLRSVSKGQPLVITGRLRISEYEVEGQTRLSVEVTADSIGHDLSRGTAVFTRVRRVTPVEADFAAAELGELGAGEVVAAAVVEAGAEAEAGVEIAVEVGVEASEVVDLSTGEIRSRAA